eukprot:433220_1
MPTIQPSINPSNIPTQNPLNSGTYNPTTSPTDTTMMPTMYPTNAPSQCIEDLSLTNEGCPDDRCAGNGDAYLDIRLSFSVCNKQAFIGRRYGLWNGVVNCLCYLSENGKYFDYSNPESLARRRLKRGNNDCNFNVIKYSMDILIEPVSINCNTTGFTFFFVIEGCGDCVTLTQSLNKIKEMEIYEKHNAIK